jgi:hypothetical protein
MQITTTKKYHLKSATAAVVKKPITAIVKDVEGWDLYKLLVVM